MEILALRGAERAGPLSGADAQRLLEQLAEVEV